MVMNSPLAIGNQRYPPFCAGAGALGWREGGACQRTTRQTYNTRVQSKVRSLANLAAASAACQPAASARRSQARRGAHPPQAAKGEGGAGETARGCLERVQGDADACVGEVLTVP